MITVLTVTVTVEAPFAVRSNSVGGHGIDLPLARDAKGNLIIPGSHIIGKLASALRELRDLLGSGPGDAFEQDLIRLFATEAKDLDAETTTGRETRRAITASDFVAVSEVETGGTRVRVARDLVTSTVAEGMLQVIEEPFAPGKPVAFKGELRLFGTVAENDPLIQRLRRALTFMTQVGGLRSVGFGRISKVEPRLENVHQESPPLPPTATRVGLRLSFRDPFCVGEARNTSNTYVSADTVSGGGIKGAIARQLLAAQGLSGFLDDRKDQLPQDYAALAEAFDDLVILHARPVEKSLATTSIRPRTVRPESLAAIDLNGSPRIMDLAGLSDPSKAVLVESRAPKLRFDWKPETSRAADEQFAPDTTVPRELRLRTQIDDSYRAAKASRLFGIEYTRPDTHDFLAEVVLHDRSDGNTEHVFAALSAVLGQGLAGLGRGGAFSDVAVAPVKDDAREPDPSAQRVVLVLQTPALLRNPLDDVLDLRVAYFAALLEIGLPAGWTVSGVFARERLAGGAFFRNRRGGATYAPWLLTEPGATLVLDRTSGSTALPGAWFRTGLPVPPSLIDVYGMDADKLYRQCPYLPENGYGEVSCGVRLPDGRVSHEALSPRSLGLSVEEIDVIEGLTA